MRLGQFLAIWLAIIAFSVLIAVTAYNVRRPEPVAATVALHLGDIEVITGKDKSVVIKILGEPYKTRETMLYDNWYVVLENGKVVSVTYTGSK